MVAAFVLGKSKMLGGPSYRRFSAMASGKVVALLGPGAFLFGDYYNQMALHALVHANRKYGVSFDVVVSQAREKVESDLESVSKGGQYDAVIAVGNAMQEPVVAIAKRFPNQRFVLVDGSVEGLDNTISYTSDPAEISFLCGQVAARLSSSAATGCVLWSDNWVAREWIAGFLLGAKASRRDGRLYFSFAKDADEAYQKALLQFGAGVEILMCHASASDIGILKAARESGKYVLGFLNERAIDPESVLFDVVRYMDPFILDAVKRATSRSFKGGKNFRMGLKEGSFGVDLSNVHPRIRSKEASMITRLTRQIRGGVFDSQLGGRVSGVSPEDLGGIRL